MQPGYRGSQLRAKMKALALTEPAFHEPVYASLGRSFVERSQSVAQSEWLSLDVDVELSGALFDVHGEAGARRISGASVEASLSGTLLGPIARGALSVFGRKPSRLLGLIPRGWSVIYRECGYVTVRTNSETNTSQLRFFDCPAGFFAPGYVEGLAGGFEAIFDFAKIQGEVVIANVDKGAKRIEMEAAWSQARDAAESGRPDSSESAD